MRVIRLLLSCRQIRAAETGGTGRDLAREILRGKSASREPRPEREGPSFAGKFGQRGVPRRRAARHHAGILPGFAEAAEHRRGVDHLPTPRHDSRVPAERASAYRSTDRHGTTASRRTGSQGTHARLRGDPQGFHRLHSRRGFRLRRLLAAGRGHPD